LLLEVALRLELGLLLRKKRCLLLGLQYPLLLFVFPVLPVQFTLPKLRDLVRLVGLWRWRRGRWPLLNLLLGTRRQRWRVLVLCQQVWWVLRQLRDGDEAREVAEIRALVVELD
jgi:hypothetical protein